MLLTEHHITNLTQLKQAIDRETTSNRKFKPLWLIVNFSSNLSKGDIQKPQIEHQQSKLKKESAAKMLIRKRKLLMLSTAKRREKKEILFFLGGGG